MSPLYDLQCPECGTRFEGLVHLSDKNLPSCPTCESKFAYRVISQPAPFQWGKGAKWN